MERCKIRCPHCNDDQCDFKVEECAECGRTYKVSELWNYDGKRLCFGCYMEVRYGELEIDD